MKITFELEQTDIDRFQQALARARQLVQSMDECDIVAAAKQSLDTLPIGSAPAYVRRQLTLVQRLILMLEDEEWALPPPMRVGLIEALVYFSDPDDLIPDHVGVIGLLDDAIMLELTLKSHQPVLSAYDDFCVFRTALGRAKDDESRHARARLLSKRRSTLVARIRKRYKRIGTPV